MSHLSLTGLVLACLVVPLSLPAAAEEIDATTVTCQELVEASQSKSNTDHMGAAVLLSWMAGYHATEDQGTVVDFDSLKKDVEKTISFCKDNPKIGVYTASQKFMGENATEQTSEAVDLATIKCERVLSSAQTDTEVLSVILMWLAGYYASYQQEKVIDFTKLGKEGTEIGKACAESRGSGLVTVAEKYMQGE